MLEPINRAEGTFENNRENVAGPRSFVRASREQRSSAAKPIYVQHRGLANYAITVLNNARFGKRELRECNAHRR